MPSNIREMMEALREAIGKASPGPWHVDAAHDGDVTRASDCVAVGAPGWASFALVVTKMADESEADEEGVANARLIALANPQTLTLLLQHVEKLEGALRDVRKDFRVEYGSDGNITALGYDSGALKRIVLTLDAALYGDAP